MYTIDDSQLLKFHKFNNGLRLPLISKTNDLLRTPSIDRIIHHQSSRKSLHQTNRKSLK